MVKTTDVKVGTKTRKSYGKIQEVMQMPNLIQVQKDSYKWFLEKGLKEALKDMAEITDYSGNLVLTFVDYRMDDKPKYSVKECKEREATYAAPMRLTARLYNKETGEVKDSEVYMGEFPLMTDSGTFIINGAERAIVSQLVRSPGVYFGMTHNVTGKKLYTSTILPGRGAWLEYETDQNDLFYVRIDKNRKIPITTLIRILGCSTNADIREFFGADDRIEATLEKDNTKNAEEALIEIYKKLRPGEPPTLSSAQTHIEGMFFDERRYDLSRVGRYKYNKKLAISDRIRGFKLAAPIVNDLTGEIIAEEGEVITTIAICSSIIVTTIVIAVFVVVFAFNPKFSETMASPAFAPAFQQVTYTIFGSLAATYFVKHWKISIFPIAAVTLLLLFVDPGIGVLIPVGVVLSMLGAHIMFKKKLVG